LTEPDRHGNRLGSVNDNGIAVKRLKRLKNSPDSVSGLNGNPPGSRLSTVIVRGIIVMGMGEHFADSMVLAF
jgi:hypothetical protein